MNRKKLLIIGVLLLILIIAICFIFYTKGKYNYVEIDKDNLGIEENMNDSFITHNVVEDEQEIEKQTDISGIQNIALFGLDRRTSDEKTSRSDSIMVATVNYDTKEIKLTSFMRDMLVDIEGKGKDKLNHAYSYGGPELAIKTLNQNFGLNIKDYVAVDFLMLEEIIDNLGGIEMEVDQEEKNLINQYMEEIAVKNNKSFDKLESFGTVNLDGGQAVAFSRIRYHGNGDYERTERQRLVLSTIIDKLSSVKITDAPAVVSSVLDNTETSIDEISAIKLATSYLVSNFSEIQTSRIPRDGSFTAGIGSNGAWSMRVDFEKEKTYLREWIYGIKN